MKNKIHNINTLAKILKKKRKNGNKIVLCHGVFDLVHFGHIAHFKRSKSFGDILVVTITADKFVNKGPNRPYFSQDLRKNFLSNIDLIDYVSEVNSPSAIEAIRKLKPNFYSKGKEYENLDKDITNKIKSEISEVRNIKKNENYNTLLKKFEELKKLKVLVVGELILDKYTACEPLGKSGKDPIMMFKKDESKIMMGGSGAIANNLSNFCKEIKLISYIGKNFNSKKFVQKNLDKKIKKEFLYINGPTIQKEKFIDKNSGSKVIGFYNFDDNFIDQRNQNKLKNLLKINLKKYDLVIVANYGHGLITDEIATLISNNAKFLVVNSQINAANILHHSLNMFKKTMCTIINEGELRHEMRDRHTNIELLIRKFSKSINSRYIVITRGTEGSKLFDTKKNKFINSAAYATKIIDKIGTGDTLMAIFAIFLKSTKNPELSLFISSLAASHNVQMMGNSLKISPNLILKTLQHLI